MKRDISKLIALSFITIISISIIYLSNKVKKIETIKNIFKQIKYKKFAYLKTQNDTIEKELGI